MTIWVLETLAFPVRTSMLMGRWRKIGVARAFIALAIAHGLPDTTEQDIPAEV